MNAVEALVTPSDAGFNPVDTAIAEADEVSREAIVSFDAFDSTTGVFLYRGSESNAGAMQALADRLPTVTAYSLVASADSQYFYCKCSFDRPGGFLTRVTSRYPVIVQPPVRFVDRETARIVLTGPPATLDEILADTADSSIEVVRTELYRPDRGDRPTALTDWQRTILDRLTERGYYDDPGRSTLADLAADLGISTAALDEQIRRIERQVFHDVVGRRPSHSNRPVSPGP